MAIQASDKHTANQPPPSPRLQTPIESFALFYTLETIIDSIALFLVAPFAINSPPPLVYF